MTFSIKHRKSCCSYLLKITSPMVTMSIPITMATPATIATAMPGKKTPAVTNLQFQHSRTPHKGSTGETSEAIFVPEGIFAIILSCYADGAGLTVWHLHRTDHKLSRPPRLNCNTTIKLHLILISDLIATESGHDLHEYLMKHSTQSTSRKGSNV